MSSPNITYTSGFYPAEKSQELFHELLKYPFQSPTLLIHGRKYNPLRKTCSFAAEDVSYTYSGYTDRPEPWTPLLLNIKADVEKTTGYSFNYCLINYYESGKAKIGAHKDNESCLDKQTPIVTVSLGATRNIIFSKKGEKSVTLPLESGSLLVVENQDWFHSIPPDYQITEPRISLTFRKIVTFETTLIPSPTKRNLDEWDKEYGIATNNTTKRVRSDPLHQAVEEIFRPSDSSSTSSDQPFLEITEDPISPIPTPMDIPNQDWLTHLVHEENKELKKIPLGENLFAIVQIYKGELGFHIREYFHNPQGELLPSKMGIRMNLPTLYHFIMKIFSMSLTYNSESTIFNNSVIGLVENRQLRLTRFTPLGLFAKSVCLTQEQFAVLKKSVSEIELCILEYLFGEKLAREVSDDIPYVPETMNSLLIHLKSLVEKNLMIHINENFKCVECECDNLSQWQHPCINANPLDKFQSVTDSIRILCNVEQVASDFLKDNPKISKHTNFMSLSSKLFEI